MTEYLSMIMPMSFVSHYCSRNFKTFRVSSASFQ